MKVIDDRLLKSISLSLWCERCQKLQKIPVDPCHIIARGMGGGSRVDVSENLVGLCRFHHNQHHQGNISQAEMWEMAAKRLGKTVQECKDYVYLVLRTPKEKPMPLPPLTVRTPGVQAAPPATSPEERPGRMIDIGD